MFEARNPTSGEFVGINRHLCGSGISNDDDWSPAYTVQAIIANIIRIAFTDEPVQYMGNNRPHCPECVGKARVGLAAMISEDKPNNEVRDV